MSFMNMSDSQREAGINADDGFDVCQMRDKFSSETVMPKGLALMSVRLVQRTTVWLPDLLEKTCWRSCSPLHHQVTTCAIRTQVLQSRAIEHAALV